MRTTLTYIVRLIVTALAIGALAHGQSSPKRRTPALTNDDLGVAGREVVRSSESEARPPSGNEPKSTRGSIEWQRDLRRAVEVARSENKLLVVDVYTDWCGWCKRMDTTIYSDPTIVALSRKQVFVKVNAEDRGQGQSFAEEMGVNGYPTTIILDEQGRVLNVAEGYIASPQAFVEFVQQARTAQAR